MDFRQYAFLYQARLDDPDHYNNDEYLKNLSDRMRQSSMRASKNWMDIDYSEWYTRSKRSFTKKFIATLDLNKDLQVKRVQVNDIADKLEIDDRGEADKLIKMIFYQKLDASDKVDVLVGMETMASPAMIHSSSGTSSSGKFNSDSSKNANQHGIPDSIFTTLINIDLKLIGFIN